MAPHTIMPEIMKMCVSVLVLYHWHCHTFPWLSFIAMQNRDLLLKSSYCQYLYLDDRCRYWSFLLHSMIILPWCGLSCETRTFMTCLCALMLPLVPTLDHCDICMRHMLGNCAIRHSTSCKLTNWFIYIAIACLCILNSIQIQLFLLGT